MKEKVETAEIEGGLKKGPDKQERSYAKRRLFEILEKFELIAKEKEPSKWFKPMARELLTLQKSKVRGLHPIYQNFIREVSEMALEAFKEEAQKKSPEEQSKIVDICNAIRNVGEKVQSDIEIESASFETVPFEELTKTGKILIKEYGEKHHIKIIRFEVNGKQVNITFPEEGVYYKGGIARIIAKIFTNSSLEGESAETDIDLIVKQGEKPVDQIMREYGAKMTDTDVVDDIDIGRTLATRDIDMNAVLVSKDGLHITQAAKKACETRIIHPLTPKNKGIFGSSTHRHEDQDLLNSSLLYRMARIVTDDKADAFEIHSEDKQSQLGIYWAILVRHYLENPDRAEKISKLFQLAKEMGQLGWGIRSPIDWLERMAWEYADFDFNGNKMTEEEYMMWLFKRLTKTIKEKLQELTRSNQPKQNVSEKKSRNVLVKIPKTKETKILLDNKTIEQFLERIEERKKLDQENTEDWEMEDDNEDAEDEYEEPIQEGDNSPIDWDREFEHFKNEMFIDYQAVKIKIVLGNYDANHLKRIYDLIKARYQSKTRIRYKPKWEEWYENITAKMAAENTRDGSQVETLGKKPEPSTETIDWNNELEYFKNELPSDYKIAKIKIDAQHLRRVYNLISTKYENKTGIKYQPTWKEWYENITSKIAKDI